MKTKDCYTELAIQISTLNMKLDKVLELLNKPEIEYAIAPIKFDVRNCDKVTPQCIEGNYCECAIKLKESMSKSLSEQLTTQQWDEEFK